VTRTFDLPPGQLQFELENNKAKRAKLASSSAESEASIKAAFTSLFDAFPERPTKTLPDPTNYGDANLDGEFRRVWGKLRLRRKGTRIVANPRIGIRGTFTSGPFAGEEFKAGLILRLGGQEGEE
jgi:hypothetical protein